MADRPILVFDINETLLDLDGLRPVFARAFGDGEVMRAWFAQLVLYSEALTLAGDYADFGALGAAVLRMEGVVRGREVSEADVQALKAAVAAMPPHPEVPAALRTAEARRATAWSPWATTPPPPLGRSWRPAASPTCSSAVSASTTA